MTKASKWHGRVEGSASECAVPGCDAPGEFRAPLTPSTFDGPGDFAFLCLDHVRAHNARYNYFAGMSADEIEAEQSPTAAWQRTVRSFAHLGTDPAPAWGDFNDPLDAIGARFRARPSAGASVSPERFTPRERNALNEMGLKEDVSRPQLRRRYADLLRRYHPDRNGGDRAHEKRLGRVIEAYQLLKDARAFAA